MSEILQPSRAKEVIIVSSSFYKLPNAKATARIISNEARIEIESRDGYIVSVIPTFHQGRNFDYNTVLALSSSYQEFAEKMRILQKALGGQIPTLSAEDTLAYLSEISMFPVPDLKRLDSIKFLDIKGRRIPAVISYIHNLHKYPTPEIVSSDQKSWDIATAQNVRSHILFYPEGYSPN